MDDDELENAEGDFGDEQLSDVKWVESDVIKAQRSKFRLEEGGWRYVIPNLKYSTVYAIRVRGKNKSGWGVYSPEIGRAHV